MLIELDENSHAYLLQLLNEKFYSTTNLEELSKINRILKQFKCKSEPWLTAIENSH